MINDPALKNVFTVLDKRAIINRFESLTGKRLITWAGEPNKHPSMNKSEFSGLRCENETLYANTPNTNLTLKEVAQELGCEETDVKKMIDYHQLNANRNNFKELVVEKRDLQKFKIGGIRHWIYTVATKIPVAKTNMTKEEMFQQLADLDESKMPEAVFPKKPALTKTGLRKNNKKR